MSSALLGGVLMGSGRGGEIRNPSRYNSLETAPSGSRDSIDIPGVSLCAPVTLELVRRLPIKGKGWVWVKVKSKITKKDTEWKRRYATLRGGVILLDKLGRNASLQVEQDHNDDWYTGFDLIHFGIEVQKKKQIIELSRPDDVVKLKMRFPNEDDLVKWQELLDAEMEINRFDAGRLSFIRQVGEGSMGKVYKVHVEGSEKGVPLAIKILEKSFIETHEDVMRLALDERAVLELVGKHSFVLGLRYALETEDQFALVTELCERGDLSNFMAERRRPMSEEKARILAAEIALGLDHLHNLGVVYRDLKTENVLLDKNGHIRIADFGLAKILGRTRNEAVLRRTRTICGTTSYFAPEMVSDGEGYSQGVDFWALGTLLHFVLSGTMPYETSDDDREEIIHKLQNEDVCISDSLSEDCQDLLRGLLEKDPERRLGKGGVRDLVSHEFFKDIDWNAVMDQTGPGIFEKFEETRRVHLMVDKEKSQDARNKKLGGTIHNVAGFTFTCDVNHHVPDFTQPDLTVVRHVSLTKSFLNKVSLR